MRDQAGHRRAPSSSAIDRPLANPGSLAPLLAGDERLGSVPTASPSHPSSEAQFSRRGLSRTSDRRVPRRIQRDAWDRPTLAQAQLYPRPSGLEQAPLL